MNRPKALRQRHQTHLPLAGRRRFLLRAAALASAAVTPSAFGSIRHPANVHVELERGEDAFLVQANAVAAATPEQAFSTLVDYDHLAEFIPDLAMSRTVSRSGTSVLVEQRGRASFGPFSQSFTLRLAVEEVPAIAIHAVATGGDFRHFDAKYELAALEDGSTRIAYRALLEPTAGVPPLVGLPIMRNLVRRQFVAMIGEVDRRGALG